MADWSSQNITLTAKGASALSKVQAGSGSLTITKVVASEQYVAESTLREVTSLSVENLPLTIIDRHEVQDGGSVIQVQLSNLYLDKAFTLNEIGVFATHSDNPSEEFLYIIAQVDAETGDKIPLYATTPVTATYDIYLYNVGADNIEITISSAGLVTYEALNKACDIIQRNTAYEVGDILHSHSLKKGLAIKCTVAGITKSTDTDLSHKNVGDTVEDGTSQWVVIAPSTTADFDAHNHSVDAHPELMKRFIESGVNVIKRSHSYAKGDIAYSDKIPSWAFLECTVAGTTSDGWYFPEPSEIKVDDTIVDYTVTWKVRKVADTASKLATARNIALTGKAAGSTTFDGSANASINVTSVNADTASKLSTARTIALSGNASGSTTFDGSGNATINATVNESAHAATATKVVTNAASGASANIAEATMAGSDYARIRVSGNDNAGELALETADNGAEPIVARQYTGTSFKTVVRTAAILDGAGNTSFPGTVTAQKFTGALNGNADTATHAATANNATKWNGLIDDHATENNIDSWFLVVSGNKIQHASKNNLFRNLGGNQTPVITDIFDRAGTIDMTTMSAADKATHKANINKASNAMQNIWNKGTGIHAYGGDYDMAGYDIGTLKLTQSYKNFDKILVVGVNDKGDLLIYKLWDVWALANAFASGSHFQLFHGGGDYWFLYGSTRKGTNTNYVLSTDTVWSCQGQNSGIVAIYGIKY